MVNGQHQHGYLIRHAQQRHAQQYILPQVKGLFHLRGDVLRDGRVALALGKVAYIHHPQRHIYRWCDNLHRLSVAGGKGCAQCFMPCDDLLDTALKRWYVERAHKPQHIGNGVDGVGGVKLMEKPEALLGKGEGQIALAPHGEERRRWLLCPPLYLAEQLDNLTFLGRQVGPQGRRHRPLRRTIAQPFPFQP